SLNGNDLEYQLLWDEILSTLIYQPTNKLTIDHQFVYIDEPMKLQVRGNGLPEVLIDSTRLTFRQHEFVSDRWQATIWPNRKGWNSIELENEQINWLYIFGPNDWIPMTNYHTLVVNQSYFDSKNNYSATQKNSRKMISKWWFLLLFLLSMGYLWLEPKLR
ncbi:MAG: hypothetical protein RLO81_03140, partial [Fulvivirga sp.]|uniref:hypothetical protein n=1 Tax=Fulvivirga sp. TaxID=1931237 RepID=UPI0032ED58E7